MTGNLSLLRQLRFLPLFATQMLGAVNDNLFKNALVVLVLYRLAAGPILVALAGGVFILPYVLFSALAGRLADAREKSRLIRLTKYWELGIMLLACLGFVTGSVILLMLVLFGLGVQATFFSPLKYGILPDHLSSDELVAGNGLIEGGTFIGILIGTIAGGALIILHAGPMIVSITGIALALAGIAAAWFVPKAEPAERIAARSGWNILKETAALLAEAKADRPVWLSLLGISWFWAIGATLLAEFPTIARVNLQAGGHVVTLMLSCFSIGVGIGSVTCARLLASGISAWLLPLASIGISIFTADFSAAAISAGPLHDVHRILGNWQGRRMLLDLLLLAACGGCYSVPLYAICQACSAPSHRSRMIAANNVLNAMAMVLAAIFTAAIYAFWPSATGILLIGALVNLIVTLWIFRILPVFRNAVDALQH